MFQQLYEKLDDLFQKKENTKDLKQCGGSVYELFETIRHSISNSHANSDELLNKANALIDYCNETILLYPFKDVPDCWRRMLIDAGLLRTMIQLDELNKEATLSKVQSLIGDLDTCCVISGSPGRYWLASDILDRAQAWISQQRSIPPRAIPKRRLPAPEIRYPIKRPERMPSFESFLSHCNQDRPTPFVLRPGLIDHWPACERWKSVDYLLKTASDRVIPVEIGRAYTDAGWRQEMMRFADFIDRYILQESEEVAYLAQHDLFYQIPRLASDMILPDYCHIEPNLNDLYTHRPQEVIKNAWFGPRGTVSPLHHDPYHNLLVQVVGSKYLRLYDPDQTDRLYPCEGMMNNTSQVNIEHEIDPDQFPKFKEANYVECILNEGEILYIPPKWWHFVKSLETSFNVSLWF
ncbi:hypothetical protein G6F57_008904 [Rhizopus arrhizus]|uniref:JmjC domain-containing protein n=1 Tax=Rhizopus oryzae TaxID=64495 RepID=A0A9P6XGH1_RHIOR|nr:hypothetical protein G6F23_002118 [Rhizopus arrhizus]KAG1414066.1 hypothetical protein G6F58_007149 [Rhizopus delemar]KAG0765060.1 hypothetical protein G6F24_004717 [Rhizopus arrhizus]KAG0785059.1 hypothetical protein G6F21_009503 [Rhizopus arrhizus]KAG0788865.1 hypothetical protein G6F22_006880 [Rhizopus arrhizus]